MQRTFKGFCVSKKQVIRDQTGKVLPFKIHDREYAKVLLPKNIDFGGYVDKNGIPIHKLPEEAKASYLVPYRCVQNHRYNDRESYISVPQEYKFRISVDLGLTGNILPDGRNEHSWTYIEGITVDQMCEYMSQNRYVNFTISKNQRGTDYFTKDNSHRTTILIPTQGGEYAGGRITCSVNHITEIDGHPNIYKVSLPPQASFTIQKNEIEGKDPLTGQNIYGEPKIIGRLKGLEIAELFKKPQEKELEMNKFIEENDLTEDLEEEGEEMS